MTTPEFAAQLSETIRGIKENGTAAIYCDNLIAYLDEVAQKPAEEPTNAELAQYQAELQLRIEQGKGQHSAAVEMFKSVITAGQNAIRSAFLLNGGAAIALLAFISNLTTNKPDKVAEFSSVLMPFVIGVLAISLTSGFTYLSQWLYASENETSKKAGFWFNMLCIALGLSSFGFFIWGMIRASEAFKIL
jgi:hypothetical protein